MGGEVGRRHDMASNSQFQIPGNSAHITNRHLILQTPGPPTEPRNPKTPKVHFEVRKMPFWNPRKIGPKSQLKCPKGPFLGTFKSPKRDFWDILIDFWGQFSGAPKWHFSDFKMHFWGFGVPGSVGGPGVCKSNSALRGRKNYADGKLTGADGIGHS